MGEGGVNMLMEENSVFQKISMTKSYNRNVANATVFSSGRCRVNLPKSSWVQSLEERFNNLTSLPIGWDGYDGLPVIFNYAYFAVSLLEQVYNKSVSPPSLVPGSDGTLQIEWHENQYDIEIDILGANNVVATRYDLVTNLEETHELKNDFSIVVEWIDSLAKERELPQQNIA